eukprot:comp23975_c0_seq2/m.42526 comp23975_c0_seq2/g.42526  ORF comp23975_c0_seq2/g.42526 comp23975_c0_seq2/m.42526 type:complete len:360 (-) comp23975_c0_seq2:329-1408(-)
MAAVNVLRPVATIDPLAVMPVAPAAGPRVSAGRSYTCQFGCVDRRYSNEHSRRQHYRRHHKDQIHTIRRRSSIGAEERPAKRHTSEAFGTKRTNSMSSNETVESDEYLHKDRTPVSSPPVGTQRASSPSSATTVADSRYAARPINVSFFPDVTPTLDSNGLVYAQSPYTPEMFYRSTEEAFYAQPGGVFVSQNGQFTYQFAEEMSPQGFWEEDVTFPGACYVDEYYVDGVRFQDVRPAGLGSTQLVYAVDMYDYPQQEVDVVDSRWWPSGPTGLTRMIDPVLSSQRAYAQQAAAGTLGELEAWEQREMQQRRQQQAQSLYQSKMADQLGFETAYAEEVEGVELEQLVQHPRRSQPQVVA